MKKINLKYDSLVKYTKLSKKEQKKILIWFLRQNILIQIDVFAEQKNQFFKLKNGCEETDIVPFAAFLLAINYFYLLKSSQNSKNRQKDLSHTSKVSKFLVKKAKKGRYKEKREKLLNLWSVVENLKAEEFSFRQISDYLRGHHRFDISHTYIRNLWVELDNGS